LVQVTFDDARSLVSDILQKHGVDREHGLLVADHLIEAASAGHGFAGLPRILALVNHLRERPPAKAIEFRRKSRNSMVIDGGGNNGYVTSLYGIDKAIELAKETGVGIVGISNTWFSGRLAYYVERAAHAGLIAIHTANTAARVAPAGGIDRIFGTNPIAFAFPCDPEPLVVDFGTGMTTWGEVLLREKLGKPLEAGWAVDASGHPTANPSEALSGAILPWGGHRGYGIALAVQIFGILCGSRTVVDDVADCGFFFLVFDPELLMPLEQFRARVSELARQIEASRPSPGVGRVRVPGRGSARRRAAAMKRGAIEVDEAVYSALLRLRDGVDEKAPHPAASSSGLVYP
jgi:LDH2 family malate/lactate/ureidoglycolate dehydrogenase